MESQRSFLQAQGLRSRKGPAPNGLSHTLGQHTKHPLPPLADDTKCCLNDGVEYTFNTTVLAPDRAESEIEIALFSIAVATHWKELILLPDAFTGGLHLLK